MEQNNDGISEIQQERNGRFPSKSCVDRANDARRTKPEQRHFIHSLTH